MPPCKREISCINLLLHGATSLFTAAAALPLGVAFHTPPTPHNRQHDPNKALTHEIVIYGAMGSACAWLALAPAFKGLKLMVGYEERGLEHEALAALPTCMHAL